MRTTHESSKSVNLGRQRRYCKIIERAGDVERRRPAYSPRYSRVTHALQSPIAGILSLADVGWVLCQALKARHIDVFLP